MLMASFAWKRQGVPARRIVHRFNMEGKMPIVASTPSENLDWIDRGVIGPDQKSPTS